MARVLWMRLELCVLWCVLRWVVCSLLLTSSSTAPLTVYTVYTIHTLYSSHIIHLIILIVDIIIHTIILIVDIITLYTIILMTSLFVLLFLFNRCGAGGAEAAVRAL
jgi:hypothetical protein